jgi:hypothetical protein
MTVEYFGEASRTSTVWKATISFPAGFADLTEVCVWATFPQ